MNLLKDNVKKIYFKYLSAAFGSALSVSVFAMVDMAMVGQYHGPDGSAALAVIAPVWNIIYSLGMLTGIGGSVLFSNLRGRGSENINRSNEYFSVSMLMSIIFSAASWAVLFFCDRPILQAFGADGKVLDIAMIYWQPIKVVSPLYLINQMLAAYIRNDGAPARATLGTLSGGVFNIFGDYFFVFVCDMGAYGAGLATAIGAVVNFAVLILHFFSRGNTLRLARPSDTVQKAKSILVTGFSTFFVDLAMGIMTILFNTQIVEYLGNDALAVYGVVVNISTIVQCCAYSAGQAAQPLVSMNYGAGKGKRIADTLKYALYTVAFFGIVWTAVCVAVPNGFIHIFMAPTGSVLEIAPAIFRCYAISFLLLPLNIFSTYYFQSLMKPAAAFIVSVGRGLVVSGLLILLLPRLVFPDAIWLAMPITEAVIAVYTIAAIRHYTSRLFTKRF